MSPKAVLTAGHCIDDSTIGVKIGTLNWLMDDIYGRNYATRRVKKQYLHPDYEKMYDPEYDNMAPTGDVGILELDAPLAGWPVIKLPKSRCFISICIYLNLVVMCSFLCFFRGTEVVCVLGGGGVLGTRIIEQTAIGIVVVSATHAVYVLVAHDAENTRTPKTFTVIGYGKTDEFEYEMSLRLREVSLDYVSRKKCEKLMNKELGKDSWWKYTITEDVICAGYLKGGKDACQGDSGGPLLRKGKNSSDDMVFGITSFGEGCARKNVPGGYTTIKTYLPWIEKTLDKIEKK